MDVAALSPDGWTLARPDILSILEKLRSVGKPLGKSKIYVGIKTGLNEAFIIDSRTKERLIVEDLKSSELIKPWLRGRDIRKWKAEWAGLYLISIPSSANKKWPWSSEKTEVKAHEIFYKTYPAIHNHLSQYKDQLKKRDDQGKFWWELRSCAYYEEFKRPKIIYADIAKLMRAAIVEEPFYADMTAFIIPSDLFLLALLHSKLFDWLYRIKFQCLGDPFNEGRLRFKTQYIEQLPIFSATDAQKAPIIKRVQAILADPDSPDVSRLEAEINKLVYDLYDLTPEEIKIVEGKK